MAEVCNDETGGVASLALDSDAVAAGAVGAEVRR